MYHKITRLYPLVASLLNRESKTIFTTIRSQSHLSITETGNNTIVIQDWSFKEG